MYARLPSFYVASRDPNSDTQVSTANTLSPEASPQPQKSTFHFTCLILWGGGEEEVIVVVAVCNLVIQSLKDIVKYCTLETDWQYKEDTVVMNESWDKLYLCHKRSLDHQQNSSIILQFSKLKVLQKLTAKANYLWT